MKEDSSELKFSLRAASAGESTTKDGDESLSFQMIVQTTHADFEDLSTLGGGDDADSILVIDAAHVIDDVENADVLEFPRFSRNNFEEKLEIIGISKFRRHHSYVEPTKEKKKRSSGRLCKYSTCCYIVRCPSCFDDLPLLVKGPALISLILLVLAIVTIVAALTVHTMMADGNNGTTESGNSSSPTRGFNAPSSFDEFMLHPQSSSMQDVSESASSRNDHIPTQPAPSPWGGADHDAGADEPAHDDEPIAEEQSDNTLDRTSDNNKSRNKDSDTWLQLFEPEHVNEINANDHQQQAFQVNNEHWVDEVDENEPKSKRKDVNDQQQQAKVKKDKKDAVLVELDDAGPTNEAPEYEANNIFVQQGKVLDQETIDSP
jgi:hypothetical protein